MKSFFPHDHNARSDKKITQLMMKMGLAGYGLYWCIVEMLYEENGWLMRSDCEGIAYQLRTDCKTIESLIDDFGLFITDGDKFTSASVLRRLEVIQEKSLKASLKAKQRWGNTPSGQHKPTNDATAMLQHSHSIANAMQANIDSNAIKENKIKGKEIKEDNNNNVGAEAPKREASFDDKYNSFIKLFNDLTGRSFKGDTKAKTQFKARLQEGYKGEDFKKAILSCKNDKYHIESDFKHLTPEFITRPDKLEKYLNHSGQKQTASSTNNNLYKSPKTKNPTTADEYL